MPSCVLVADGGRARIFRAAKRSRTAALTEVADLIRPTARLAAREITTDVSGRVFARSRVGQGPRVAARAGAGSDADPHRPEIERFARRICRRLDEERRTGGIDDLVIIAEPHFLGQLRLHLSGPTRRLITREIARNLTRQSTARIAEAAFTRPPG